MVVKFVCRITLILIERRFFRDSDACVNIQTRRIHYKENTVDMFVVVDVVVVAIVVVELVSLLLELS